MYVTILLSQSEQLIVRERGCKKRVPGKPGSHASEPAVRACSRVALGDPAFYEDALDLYVRGEWADDFNAE